MTGAIPEANLPLGVTGNYSRPCMTCGGTLTVVDTVVQPHRCRIDLDAQRSAWNDPPWSDNAEH